MSGFQIIVTIIHDAKVSIVGSLREVACSASDRQGSNFESCVWRTVSSQSSHHPQEVLLAQFSLYMHKCGLKPDSFHFISFAKARNIASGYLLMNLTVFLHILFQDNKHRRAYQTHFITLNIVLEPRVACVQK